MLTLKGQRLSLDDIHAVARGGQVSIAPEAVARMEASRRVIDSIVDNGEVVYGVTTGFGRLSSVHIPKDKLKDLQHNLVRSHACGVGRPLSEEESRALTLLRANVLALGFSGCRPLVVATLIQMLNKGVTAVIPERGSVGASGDLAPLAHLALAVIGEGECIYKGGRFPAADALKGTAIAPLDLDAKEGLALLNGTQAMAAVGGLALHRAANLCRVADIAGAMTLEALRDTPVAFDPRIQDARPHRGQAMCAAHLRELLRDSEIRESHREGDARVQDAYSLRCIPQVHGAVQDVIDHAVGIVEIETAAATDNPLVFAETGDVLSGGNFHGAPLAYAFDYACIALTDLASISERRIDRLVNPDLSEGLPPFLTEHAGMESGFMIPHVAAVSLLSECKVLSHPASVDNVPTSGGKEDHVSMGMTSALKLRSIVGSVERVLAIELLAAAQGLEFRKPLRPGVGILKAYEAIREISPAVTGDRSLAPDVEALATKLAELNS